MKGLPFWISIAVACLSWTLTAAPTVTIVFPPAGSSVPAEGRTFVIGSVHPSSQTLTVNAQTVTPWRTGGFLVMTPVVPGSNTLLIQAGPTAHRHTFHVPYPAPAWNGQSIRVRSPAQTLGVYTGECVRLACSAPAHAAIFACVGERTVALASEAGTPTFYSAQMAFSAPAENVPVTFFAEGLADAPAAALSARSEWPVYSVTGPLFETRARSQPGAGETVAFLPPNLRLQGAGFVGSNTRIWLAGALSFAENRFLSAETESSPPPPRESPLPDLSAGFGPYPPTNRTPEQILIVIDPGHGGSSTGAIGPTGVTEKQATLEQAQVIKATLERAGFRVLLTRDRDVDRGLYERVQLAYSARAAAFISVHYNSCGASSSPEASRHIATYCWNPIGEQLARALHPHLASVTPIANRGVCTASFAVCRNPAIPSCLAELDFITCPEGEEALRQPDRQRKVAEALLEGLRDWLGRAAP